MPILLAQYGTKHGHAAGKARAIQTNPQTSLAGIYEPDAEVRTEAERSEAYRGVHWYRTRDEMLGDARVQAIAIEGQNGESLAMASEALDAGKHLWYDKPAGDDWPAFESLVARARSGSRILQMGYMFRYHAGFRQIAEWVKSGRLGDVFSVRAHMSTWIPVQGRNGREAIARHTGGIFYDLAGHMLDQIVWLCGRPRRMQSFFRNDATPMVPAFADNTLGVFEFERAMALVDIAAMEARPMARRFEVYGTRGTALLEPFEPAPALWLCLDEAREGYAAGQQAIPLDRQPRQTLYDRELAAFVATLNGDQPPDRDLDHERLVQETLLRATGGIPGSGE
ncbi:MAG: Gfo/Idh/MocA family protein [Chloroflexota bacterium]